MDGRPNRRNKAAFFCDRLVWTVGLTVEIKLLFSNFSSAVWTWPNWGAGISVTKFSYLVLGQLLVNCAI